MRTTTQRPKIEMRGAVIVHNGEPVRVVVRRGSISIGCTDVSIEAARALLQEYDERFSVRSEEIGFVIQDGAS